MRGTADLIAAVDVFISVPKLPVGIEAPTWQPGRNVHADLRITVPLEIDGEQPGHNLFVTAHPNSNRLEFEVGLQFHDYVVDRLDFDSEAVHGNNFRPLGAGLSKVIFGSHWHSWEVNRSTVTAATERLKLPNAIAFTHTKKFDAALRWYCGQRNIELGHHGIVYPERTTLL